MDNDKNKITTWQRTAGTKSREDFLKEKKNEIEIEFKTDMNNADTDEIERQQITEELRTKGLKDTLDFLESNIQIRKALKEISKNDKDIFRMVLDYCRLEIFQKILKILNKITLDGTSILTELCKRNPQGFDSLIVLISITRDFAESLTKMFNTLSEIGNNKKNLNAFCYSPDIVRDSIQDLTKKYRTEIIKKYLMEDGFIDVNRFLEEHEAKLYIDCHENASINASDGMIKALHLKKDNIVLCPTLTTTESILAREITADDIKKRINSSDIPKKFRTVEDIQEHIINKNDIIISFSDHFILPSVDKQHLVLPYISFKYLLPSPTTEEDREKLRDAVNAMDRKIIIISSPSPDEKTEVINAYKKFPDNNRPILILGMRHLDNTLRKELENDWFKVNERNTKQDNLSAIGENDVTILNTVGELSNLMSISDVTIVGEDRNLFEPASQNCPILYFDGDRINNKLGKQLMDSHKGAIAINQHKLFTQIQDILNNPKDLAMGTKEAIQEYNDRIVPAAKIYTSLLIINSILTEIERAKNR